jgi:hypothetical protein
LKIQIKDYDFDLPVSYFNKETDTWEEMDEPLYYTKYHKGLDGMTSLIYTEAFLNRQDAEIKRQEFIDENMDLGLELVEDEIKYINLHHVVRILFSDRQQEFDLG